MLNHISSPLEKAGRDTRLHDMWRHNPTNILKLFIGSSMFRQTTNITYVCWFCCMLFNFLVCIVLILLWWRNTTSITEMDQEMLQLPIAENQRLCLQRSFALIWDQIVELPKISNQLHNHLHGCNHWLFSCLRHHHVYKIHAVFCALEDKGKSQKSYSGDNG